MEEELRKRAEAVRNCTHFEGVRVGVCGFQEELRPLRGSTFLQGQAYTLSGLKALEARKREGKKGF